VETVFLQTRHNLIAQWLVLLGKFVRRVRFSFFLKKLRVHDQQTERLTVLLGRLGVVRPVRPKYGPAVPAIQLSKPPKPLVDVHVVDQKIGQSVQRNTHAHKKHPEIRVGLHTPKHVAKRRRNGKNQKKSVIFFKKTVLVVLREVVVSVPRPQHTVHQVLVREPRHEFHADVRGQCYEGVEQPVGHNLFLFEKTPLQRRAAANVPKQTGGCPIFCQKN
jgi:hypothetical protein